MRICDFSIVSTRNCVVFFRNYGSQCDRSYGVTAPQFHRNEVHGLSSIVYNFIVRWEDAFIALERLGYLEIPSKRYTFFTRHECKRSRHKSIRLERSDYLNDCDDDRDTIKPKRSMIIPLHPAALHYILASDQMSLPRSLVASALYQWHEWYRL